MMTASERPVTDNDLHAFVDGQLDAARAGDVFDWLQTHRDDAARVAEWQAQRLQLRSMAREFDVGETPAALTQPVVRVAGLARRRAAWQQAAAALAVLALGLAGGHWWGRQGVPGDDLARLPGFVRDAGVAHAVYTPEKRHPVEVAASDEAHLVQWLGRRLGTPLKAPQLGERGFRLLGGRLLPGEGSARAQFMYENAQGGRLTLYMAAFKPGEAPAETSFRSVRDGARESFYWVEGRFGYALSGELPAAELQALAREVYAQLAR
jgi:anti-sigma factor RsiW